MKNTVAYFKAFIAIDYVVKCWKTQWLLKLGGSLRLSLISVTMHRYELLKSYGWWIIVFTKVGHICNRKRFQPEIVEILNPFSFVVVRLIEMCLVMFVFTVKWLALYRWYSWWAEQLLKIFAWVAKKRREKNRNLRHMFSVDILWGSCLALLQTGGGKREVLLTI